MFLSQLTKVSIRILTFHEGKMPVAQLDHQSQPQNADRAHRYICCCLFCFNEFCKHVVFHTGTSDLKRFALYTPPLCFSFLFWAKPPSRLICSKAVSKVLVFFTVCLSPLFVSGVCVCACVCVCVYVCACACVRACVCVKLKGTLHSHFTWKMGQYTSVVCYYFHRVL